MVVKGVRKFGSSLSKGRRFVAGVPNSFLPVSSLQSSELSKKSRHDRDKEKTERPRGEGSASKAKKDSYEKPIKSENKDKTSEKIELEQRQHKEKTEKVHTLATEDDVETVVKPLRVTSRKPLRTRSLSLGASGRKLITPHQQKRSSHARISPNTHTTPATTSSTTTFALSDLTLSSSGASDIPTQSHQTLNPIIADRGRSLSHDRGDNAIPLPPSRSPAKRVSRAISSPEEPDLPITQVAKPVIEGPAGDADFKVEHIPDYYRDYFLGKGTTPVNSS